MKIKFKIIVILSSFSYTAFQGNLQFIMKVKKQFIKLSQNVAFQPIQLLSYTFELLKPGKFPAGKTEIPFEIPLKLKSNSGKQLYETYHGVFVNVQVEVL